MAAIRLIEYEDASPEVRAVYEDIMTTRKVDAVNNFWKAIANDPATLRRTWESLKQIMQPGALDPLTKELLYIAARKRGMTDEMLYELMAVIGMASETNRLATGYQVEIDPSLR